MAYTNRLLTVDHKNGRDPMSVTPASLNDMTQAYKDQLALIADGKLVRVGRAVMKVTTNERQHNAQASN